MPTTTKTRRRTRTRSSTASRPTSSQRAAQAEPLVPFTVEHWVEWARNLVLDNGENFEPEPFQVDFVRDVFTGGPGGTRIKQAWLLIPEANAKTTLNAAIALYVLDYLPDATILLAASSRDQAGLLFKQAGAFVRRSGPWMAQRFKVFKGYRRIDSMRMGGSIQVVAADEGTADGAMPDMVILDEVHRLRDLALLQTLLGKLGKRKGQMICLSTAGAPGSEFEELRARMRQAGHVTTRLSFTRAAAKTTLIHDYHVAPDRTDDMVAVLAANPLSTITLETLTEKKNELALPEAHWKRFTCNVPARADSSGVAEPEWARARTADRIPAGVPVWVGGDMGWTHDTTAFTPLWMPDINTRLFGNVEIIKPPGSGRSTEPPVIFAALQRIHARNPIEVFVYDPQAGGEQVAYFAEHELGAIISPYGSNIELQSLAYERWQEALRNGWLKHSDDEGDAEFSRQVLNAIAKTDSQGKTRFDRSSSSRAASKQDQRVWDALAAGQAVHSARVTSLKAPERYDGPLFEHVY